MVNFHCFVSFYWIGFIWCPFILFYFIFTSILLWSFVYLVGLFDCYFVRFCFNWLVGLIVLTFPCCITFRIQFSDCDDCYLFVSFCLCMSVDRLLTFV